MANIITQMNCKQSNQSKIKNHRQHYLLINQKIKTVYIEYNENSQMPNKQTNSKFRQSALYHSNMSDIKESIEENFGNSLIQDQISEAISAQKNISLLKSTKQNNQKSTKDFKKPQIKSTEELILEDQENEKENALNLTQNNKNFNEPINLGDQIFKVVAERYRQIQGNETVDPEVLFDFFKRQKKNFQPKRSKSTLKNATLDGLNALMPSSQRRLLLKVEFQKILSYYANDVYYTLCCGAEKRKKDLELANKAKKLALVMEQRPQSKRKDINTVIQRLYPLRQSAEKTLPGELQQYEKRNRFGTRLLECFINHFRNHQEPPEPTAEKLHGFWEDTYEREQFEIQWDESTAKEDIKLFMMQQVLNLLVFLQKKLGFKTLNEGQLKKFYSEYYPVANVAIPIKYLKVFILAFNDVMKDQQNKKLEQQRETNEKKLIKQKQMQLRKFGRPVSATPLSILSKAKIPTNLNLTSKYEKDKILSMIMRADKIKIARKSFQYGIYDIEDEIKTKGRIKPQRQRNFDQTIFQELSSTFCNHNLSEADNLKKIRDLISRDKIFKEQIWRKESMFLQEAMQVQCYESIDFRNTLTNFYARLAKVKKDQLKFIDDKFLVSNFIKHLSSLDDQKRNQTIYDFDEVLTQVQRKKRSKQSEESLKKNQTQADQKRLFYDFLNSEACKYVDLRVNGEQINTREYLNELFASAIKEHKQFVIKHFHVVEGEKDCPKLLKNQFFRIQKDINPITKQKDLKAKCHAWIPPSKDPNNFNSKTFNTFSNAYKIYKNIIVPKEEPANHKNSIWGFKKGNAKLRENLMMTFDDAKQCVFYPKCSRNN